MGSGAWGLLKGAPAKDGFSKIVVLRVVAVDEDGQSPHPSPVAPDHLGPGLLGVPGPGAENPTDMWARSAGIITRQARHRAGLAGLRWRVRYTVGRDTVNSSARSAME